MKGRKEIINLSSVSRNRYYKPRLRSSDFSKKINAGTAGYNAEKVSEFAPKINMVSNRNTIDSEAEEVGCLESIRVLQFNADGLSIDTAVERIHGLCFEVLSSLDPKPDVIFFQEIVPETLREIRKNLEYKGFVSSADSSSSSTNSQAYQSHHSDLAIYQIYTPFDGKSGYSAGYFTGILLNINTIKVTSNHLFDFSGSNMGRNLLKVEGMMKFANSSPKLSLFCSHLESTALGKKQRMEQLRMLFSEMQNSISSGNNDFSIFGGDANLRDSEQQLARDTKMMPLFIHDAWEAFGFPLSSKYTWDMNLNNNLGDNAFEGDRKPRCRYDRVFFINANEQNLADKAQFSQSSLESRAQGATKSKQSLKLINFELIGTNRLKNSPRKMFPSDHFGILCDFEIE